MRTLLTLIAFVFFIANTAHAALFTTDYGSALPNSSNCDDCADGPINFGAGHSLSFFGNTYAALYVGSNGYVTFGASSTNYTSVPLDTQAIRPMIAGLFTDLDSRDDSNSSVYLNTSTPGQLIVTWITMGHFSRNFSVRNTFQLVIRSDQYIAAHPGSNQIGFFYGNISDSSTASAGFGDGLAVVNAGEQAFFSGPANQLSNAAPRWYGASGASVGAEIRSVYPDNNFSDRRTYKHHGDYLRIVVGLDSSTGADSTGVLRLDLREIGGASVDGNWSARVYKRHRRLMPTYQYVGGGEYSKNPDSTATSIGINFNLNASETGAEYIFIVKLQDNSPQSPGAITANASIVGGVSSKSLAGPIIIGGSRRIMLVNESVMYKTFGMKAGESGVDLPGLISVNNFFETLYSVAADANAVVMPVDLYDFYGSDPTSFPTLDWATARKALPYGTGYANAEAAVNAAANTVDAILDAAISRSGGMGEMGRHVAIIGDDRIIPYYRVSDPAPSGYDCDRDTVNPQAFLRCYATPYSNNFSLHGTSGSLTQQDAFNGYMYTDLRYRVNANWDDQKIYLGRIIGSPAEMGRFLVSSNSPQTRIGRVLKLENDERNGQLADWDARAAGVDGYTVLKSVNGKNTDDDCGLGQDTVRGDCYKHHWLSPNEGGYDDPAHATDFMEFFQPSTTASALINPTFDIYRGMTHGDMTGVYSSKSPGDSHAYFSNETLRNVSFADRGFHPFFILDACLVGNVGDSSDGFINRLSNTGIRGAFASSVITFSGNGFNQNISKYNDTFYRKTSSTSAGAGLNGASKILRIANNSTDYSTRAFSTIHRAGMNLFGLPWAEVAQPASASAQQARSAAYSALLAPRSAVNESLGTINIEQINVDGEQADLLSVAGFGQHRSSPTEPVLPFKDYEFTLPADAAVSGVNVLFAQVESLGSLRLPGYRVGVDLPPPYGVADRFVSLATGTGVFPLEKFEYTVSHLDDQVVVRVRVMPFTYDRATRMVTAYKQFSVDVNYTTASGVVFNGATLEKGVFHGAEAMPISLALSNTQSGSATVAIEYSMLDADGNQVASGTENVTLAGYEEGIRVLRLVAPTLPGPATLKFRVVSNGSLLGATERVVQIANMAIENVTVPAFVSPGETVNVLADVVNLSSASTSGTVTFVVYRDGQEIGQLTPQPVSNLASGGRVQVSSNWIPPQDLAGSYLTVAAAVTMNGNSISSRSVPAYVGVFHNLNGVANTGAGGSVSCTSPVPTGEAGSCTVSASNGYSMNGVSSTCGGALSGSVFTTDPLTAECTVTATFVNQGTVPDAPTNLLATPGDAQASISFSPPANDGGWPIEKYDARCFIGFITFGSKSGTASPLVVTGLPNNHNYQCEVSATNALGTSAQSVPVSVTPVAPVAPPRLINLSTRGQVQTGDNVMIGGFVISGSTPKKVLVRAVGPNLANYGVTGVLGDPKLQLYSGPSVIASNDDWIIATNASDITATGLAPVNPLESAILITLSPGAYTAIVSGFGGGTGVGIVEVYEVDNPVAPFSNISTRGKVQTGDNVMIGGFIIEGATSQTVLIRAVGPNLANYGVTGVLADPMLQLYSGQTVIATNDDWGSASNAAAITATSLAPANELESAILVTLQPGAYTAVVSGFGGGTGVGIIEVFAP